MVFRVSSETIVKWRAVVMYALVATTLGAILYRSYNQPQDQISVAIAVPALLFLGMGQLLLYLIPGRKSPTEVKMNGPRWAIAFTIFLAAATMLGLFAAYLSVVFWLSSVALGYLAIPWAAVSTQQLSLRLILRAIELLTGTAFVLILFPFCWHATIVVRHTFNELFESVVGGILPHRHAA